MEGLTEVMRVLFLLLWGWGWGTRGIGWWRVI
jgi:hypothetical protein